MHCDARQHSTEQWNLDLTIINWTLEYFKRKHLNSLTPFLVSCPPAAFLASSHELVQFSFDSSSSRSCLWQTMKIVWMFSLVISSIIEKWLMSELYILYCAFVFCSWQCPVRCQSTLMYTTSVSQHHDCFSSPCTGLGPYLHFKLWGKWTCSAEWFAF